MTRPILFIGLTWILILSRCLSPFAQDDGNRYSGLLKQVLSANSQGQCPSSLMAAMLLAVCEQQISNIEARLSQLGAITSVKFVGIQQTQFGPAEVYTVNFQNGTMNWMINA